MASYLSMLLGLTRVWRNTRQGHSWSWLVSSHPRPLPPRPMTSVKVTRPNLGHVLIWVTSNKMTNCGPQKDCTASLRRSNYSPFYARYSHIRESAIASVSLAHTAAETLPVSLGRSVLTLKLLRYTRLGACTRLLPT